jgi:hypothetical protein
MKKFAMVLFATVLALVMTLSLGVVAFAWSPSDADADVTIDAPVVPTTPVTGTEITISGKVKIEADSQGRGFFVFTGAESEAGYSVENPNGGILSSGSNSESDSDFGIFRANSDAEQTYTWQFKFKPTLPGDYTIDQYGEAWAWYWALIGGYGDAEDCLYRTTTFRVWAPSQPCLPRRTSMLHIITPNGVMSPAFYPTEGYNTGAVSQDITFASGNTIITILKGTMILMDGQPQLQIWLIFNPDGTVVGRWGANVDGGMGWMLAKTVEFSQLPIVLTSK